MPAPGGEIGVHRAYLQGHSYVPRRVKVDRSEQLLAAAIPIAVRPALRESRLAVLLCVPLSTIC